MGQPVELKNAAEVSGIRAASLIVHDVLQVVLAAVRPGVTTLELDRIAEQGARTRGARPAFKGYSGYPHATCISVNDEVVHGIPSERTLGEGDIVGIDFGVSYRGFFGDSAYTVAVGQASEGARALIAAAREALARAVAAARPGARLGDLGFAVESYVQSCGYSVVREFVGHGIGRQLHESPPIPNFGDPGTGLLLQAGMVLAIEPMVNVGRPEIRTLDDGWTAVTADGSLSAHFEHTVAITPSGPEILSLPPGAA